MTEKKFSVKQIGWENSQEQFPVVLICKSDRNALNTDLSEFVKVTKITAEHSDIEVSSVAIVNLQFRNLIEAEKCTINTKLAEDLELKIDDKVKISTELTESEVATARKNMREQMRRLIFGQ
jgi:hypothetical protein